MSGSYPTPPKELDLYEVKRQASHLKVSSGKPMWLCREEIAHQHGYSTYIALTLAAKEGEATR